jgi:hypothetical protein
MRSLRVRRGAEVYRPVPIRARIGAEDRRVDCMGAVDSTLEDRGFEPDGKHYGRRSYDINRRIRGGRQ